MQLLQQHSMQLTRSPALVATSIPTSRFNRAHNGRHGLTERASVKCRSHGLESVQQATERRMRESAEVDDRVVWCTDVESVKRQLREAGTKLVVLEIQSDSVCEAGFDDEPELHWKLDQEAAMRKSMEACSRIKHTFARTARECTDVVFISMQVPEGPEGDSLKDDLGVALVPAIQFFREGTLLWQQQGHTGMEQEMGEGVLYYGNAAAGGLKATEYVHGINTRQELDQFVQSPDDNTLKVVNVSTTLCKPCIKVYPAVLALAKNFVGHAEFGRLMGDDSDETEGLMRELGIIEVPTFIFYRRGKEIGRHVGSSRGDLIGNILAHQTAAGLQPPPPPPRAKTTAKARTKQRPAARRW